MWSPLIVIGGSIAVFLAPIPFVRSPAQKGHLNILLGVFTMCPPVWIFHFHAGWLAMVGLPLLIGGREGIPASITFLLMYPLDIILFPISLAHWLVL